MFSIFLNYQTELYKTNIKKYFIIMCNKDLITSFYEAFAIKDFKTMGSLYHKDVHFEDEIFKLDGKEVSAMWHMLINRGKNDLQIEFSNVIEKENIVTAHWEAKYPFSVTKRPVHNRIDAQFKFKDGKIIEHIDSFDFWNWTKQALGFTGYLLGWSPYIKNKVVTQANNTLKSFISINKEYQ